MAVFIISNVCVNFLISNDYKVILLDHKMYFLNNTLAHNFPISRYTFP